MKREDAVLRDLIVAEAVSWVGTAYHHRARVKGVGVDCAQLLIGTYAAVGLCDAFDTGDYPRDWHVHHDEEKYLGFVERYAVRVDAPDRGDIALYKFARCVSHAAIVIDWPQVVHSHVKLGCAHGSNDEAELAGRLHSVWSVVRK